MSAPAQTPMTKAAINPAATAALIAYPATPTAKRVELPLMKETKKPPETMNPIAST